MNTGETKPGLFLVLEGIDGSGTTTQAEILSEALRSSGYRVVLTREPTKGPVGRFLRQALAGNLEEDGALVSLGWDSMALLFAADRMDHLRREILPSLEEGAIVISDRYDLSSLIYQSATCEAGDEVLPWLSALNERARRPDLTLVLDIDPDAAQARRTARAGAEEIYERADLQHRLAHLYRHPGDFLPRDRIFVISGEGSREEVAERIALEVRRLPEFGTLAAAR